MLPTYNGECTALVAQLNEQAGRFISQTFHYEIIVADDGSTNQATITANRQINEWPCCRYFERGFNAGRAVIRNFLAQQASCDWLLFLDSDMRIISDDFLQRYLNRPDDELVVDGGLYTDPDLWKSMPWSLRCRYESAANASFAAEKRQLNPYHDFHTANFLVRRDVMLSHPFDERFRHYGYEDVLLGKQLRTSNIAITHIGNPVSFSHFESNDSFVRKTEEGLHTLHTFREDLRGYSRLLTFVNGIHFSMVKRVISWWHSLFGGMERRLLCSRHPNLKVFKIYKLGYYLKLCNND